MLVQAFVLMIHMHTSSRLSALIKYHKIYSVNMKAIYDLVYKLNEYNTEISSASPFPEWVSEN